MTILNDIKNYFNKLFKSKSNISGSIITLECIEPLPKRIDFKDDKNKLDLINHYKKEYLKLLTSKRLISSAELSLDSLLESMTMNINLLFNIFYSYKDYIAFSFEELKIQSIKLFLYEKEIERLENITVLRLVVLTELQKDLRIPKSNKAVLESAINNLHTSLVSYKNQKVAIASANLTFKKRFENAKDEKNIARNKYERLKHIANGIVDVNPNVDDYIAKVAIIERELEIYVYKHKNEIEFLREKLKELDSTNKNRDNKQELLKQLSLIEVKFKIFQEYGRNLVSEEDITYLYEVKFNILVYNLYFSSGIQIDKHDEGYTYYKEIVSQKISRLFEVGNKNVFQNFGNNTQRALKLIKEYFKNGTNEYQIDLILNSKLRLCLLLAFDTKNGLKKMFENIRFRTHFPYPFSDKNNYESTLSNINVMMHLEDEVSLRSALEIISIFYPNYNAILYKLYSLIPSYKVSDKEFKFPEGIIEIDCCDMTRKDSDRIRERCKNKAVYLPSTLKSIDGDLFSANGISEIYLNDGLEYIGFVALKFDGYYIDIPPSVKYISRYALNKVKLKSILFKDWENSELLKSKEAIKECISRFIIKRKTGNIKYICLSDDEKTTYSEELPIYIILGDNYNIKDTLIEYELSLDLLEIVLESNKDDIDDDFESCVYLYNAPNDMGPEREILFKYFSQKEDDITDLDITKVTEELFNRLDELRKMCQEKHEKFRNRNMLKNSP